MCKVAEARRTIVSTQCGGEGSVCFLMDKQRLCKTAQVVWGGPYVREKLA